MSVSKWLHTRATALMRERGIVCNCGGPQYGTDHAPDCALERAWDDAMEDAKQEYYEKFTWRD